MPRAVEIAKANAQAAGVAGDITFTNGTGLACIRLMALLASIHRYVERLFDDAGVTKLYAEMGQVFCTTETCGVSLS